MTASHECRDLHFPETAGFQSLTPLSYVDYLMWPRQTTNTLETGFIAKKHIIIDRFIFRLFRRPSAFVWSLGRFISDFTSSPHFWTQLYLARAFSGFQGLGISLLLRIASPPRRSTRLSLASTASLPLFTDTFSASLSELSTSHI
jgi:hypothetical protein